MEHVCISLVIPLTLFTYIAAVLMDSPSKTLICGTHHASNPTVGDLDMPSQFWIREGFAPTVSTGEQAIVCTLLD